MGRGRKYRRALMGMFMFLFIFSAGSKAADIVVNGKKVLVVMSYHDEVVVEQEIKKGLDVLLKDATVKYFWLNTKNALEKGHETAREAYALYQEFQPDAVIAVNDNAQRFFVMPYLKEKVGTPVIFCGVNNDAAQYGYPADNVTGVLEKKHYRESISFAQIIKPAIKRLGIIYKDNPSNRANLMQIEQEKASYSADISEVVQVSTEAEIKKAAAFLSERVDALLILDLAGIRDKKGDYIEEQDIIVMVSRLSEKPTIGVSMWEIKAGIFAGVIKTNEEQARLAVDALFKVWNGNAVKDVPITQNKNGRRIINMTTANRLGITIPSEAIMGTEIVLSEQEKKVLVVMSYHEDDSWTGEIREGIESTVKNAHLKFFYLDTKKNNKDGNARAAEAYALYQDFLPDAVIAADDNAQSLFVVPYLKDRITTPVVFCGVNFDASKYGYPASNVTGVLEKIHYRESFNFAQIIDPSIKKVTVLYRDTESSRKNIAQLEQEKASYSVEIFHTMAINSITDAFEAIDYCQSRVDAFLLLNPTGISDERGKPMEGVQAIEAIVRRSTKPIINNTLWAVSAGSLCGVVRSGYEQGVLAGRMVRTILNGKPIRDIPIDQNRNGMRIINVTVAKQLGLEISGEALLGTELVH